MRDGWTARDYLILEALQMYEESICGGCGQSTIHSLDEGNSQQYEVRAVTCQGCASAPEDPPTPAHGEQTYVVSLMSEEDGDREPYLYEEDFGGSHEAPAHVEPIPDPEDGGA